MGWEGGGQTAKTFMLTRSDAAAVCFGSFRRHCQCHRANANWGPIRKGGGMQNPHSFHVSGNRLQGLPCSFQYWIQVLKIAFSNTTFHQPRLHSYIALVRCTVKTKPRFGECYTCFGCQTKTGVVRILVIFQDKPTFNHIIQNVSARAFHWCGWT